MGVFEFSPIWEAILYVLCAITIACLAIVVSRTIRRLNRRIIEFQEDETQNTPPANPYAALAELFDESNPPTAQSNGSSKRKHT